MFLSSLVLFVSTILQPQPGKSTNVSIAIGSQSREYVLHVPKNYSSNSPHALVVAFHGLGESAQTMEDDSGLSAKAEAENFIVVYPNGTGTKGSWNAGSCCEGNTSNDILFVKEIIKDVSHKLVVDSKRIYAVGMSNGGMMANRVAIEMADQIAAIASVAGTSVFSGTPSRPIPVMHVHGTSDTIVKYSTVTAHKQYWITHNGANPVAVKRILAPPPLEVSEEVFAAANASNADVVVITIVDGGHLWPGRPVPNRIELPIRIALGQTTQVVSANDEIWKFFASHPRP